MRRLVLSKRSRAFASISRLVEASTCVYQDFNVLDDEGMSLTLCVTRPMLFRPATCCPCSLTCLDFHPLHASAGPIPRVLGQKVTFVHSTLDPPQPQAAGPVWSPSRFSQYSRGQRQARAARYAQRLLVVSKWLY
jgi:hypothetical protein